MFFWLLFTFCAGGAAYGLWSIPRDLGRGHVQGRGFGFDRATQPLGFYALITFNCLIVAILLVGALVLGFNLLRHVHSN
jgi:hypothetical protein